MAELKQENWAQGCHSLLDSEKIPRGASSNEMNWLSFEDRIELARGKYLIGARESGAGKVRGLHCAYKNDGTSVWFRKITTKVQFFNTATNLWVDVITGLTSGAEYTFANYFSLAGAFVYVCGIDGIYKICTANPGSYTSLYDSTINFKGKIMISSGRMYLWDRVEDRTGLYLSWIDAIKYTTVTAEVIGTGDGSHKTYANTLTFKAGEGKATCFGITVTDGTEIFTDDFNGVLTGSAGGTGTINYTTGAISVTFHANVTNHQNVTCTYQWENSNDNGVSDFSKSSPRQAGEGAIFRQDDGGDRIMNVLLFDNKYYSIKARSVYELDLTSDDTNATNLVFRKDIGMQFFRSAVATSLGIIFMDTANPDKPKLTQLQRNVTGDNLIPVELAPQFKFANYSWEECAIETWGEYIIITAKEGDNSDTILLFNSRLKTVDIIKYTSSCLMKDSGLLYTGDSITDNMFQIFSGMDDDGYNVENFWEGNNERYDMEDLKRVKRLTFRGLIGSSQIIEIYISLDNDGFKKVGEIDGSGSYVDNTDRHVLGANMIGTDEIGGGGKGSIIAYPYFTQIRLQEGKFHSRKLKYKAVGIGYASISFESDYDIRVDGWNDRLPKKYR